MGTVGLNFGSPTSGTGFDVSATVSSIIGNLKNVETPWTTQLTALQKQDSAISNLGTLLSTLSNDLSQITDFTGVLAQKTGFSSSPNVLELTSATSSASSGTHSVVVNNLAQTSSGYLTEVASASDLLTGSITLSAGTGSSQTIDLPSGGATLQTLASEINSSNAGVTASVLTDSSGSRLSLVSGTSGAGGNMTVTASLNDKNGTILGYTGSAGTSSQVSSGSLASVGNSSDLLTGSVSIQVGGAAAQTVSLGSSGGTLQDLANAINNTSGIGVKATLSSDGTALSLVSQTAGASGTLTVGSKIVDTSASSVGYLNTVKGADASLTIDGVNLTSSSNVVTNLIPGLTFQLLSPSSTDSSGNPVPVQVVIGNDNSSVESVLNQFVSDYNSLISAVNTQEGTDSSGNGEPLFGSPTLSLLQQQLLAGLNAPNPNGYLDSIATNTGTTLAGTVTLTTGSGLKEQVVIGAAPASPAANTLYTGSGTGYNTLQGLADAINAADSYTSLVYSGASGSATSYSTGTLTSVFNADTAVSGKFTIQVGSNSAYTVVIGAASGSAATHTIYTGSGVTTLSSLAAAINNAGIGVTAAIVNANGKATLQLTSQTLDSAGDLTVTTSSPANTPAGEALSLEAAGLGITAGVVTTNNQSTLSLGSQTSGSAGALIVNSNITATGGTLMSVATAEATPTVNSTATLSGQTADSDTLGGSIVIQVGSGAAKTVTLNASDNTLSGLATAINEANVGVTATVVPSSDGSGPSTLQIVSNTAGTAGALNITSNIDDMSQTSSKTLGYNTSSDITSLASLGITISSKDDGSLDFDVASLDATLNSDFSSVQGFFQSITSWGQRFSTMLNNSGTSSSSGMLKLELSSNSSIESTLNADITNEDSLISVQQKSLTAELNSANQIMQELPAQLESVNELYSAITGYNQKS